MALSITEQNTVQHTLYDPKMQLIVYDASPVWKLGMSKYKVSWPGGNDLQWPVRYKKLADAKATGFREQITFSSTATRTGAKLDWAAYKVQTAIHWDERSKNSPSDARILDLTADRNTEAREDLQDKLATDLWVTNSDTNALTDLSVAVDSGGTYAGIAVADAAAWASQEDSSTTKVKIFGSGSIAEMINACTLKSRMPTSGFTTRDLYSKIESLVVARQQTTMQDKEVRNLGVSNFKFHDVEFIAEPFMPSGDLYLMDMKSLAFRCHPDFSPVKSTGWFDLTTSGFPEARALIILFQGNVVLLRRDTSGKFTALDYTL
jgi:hypothetical protein